MSLRDYFKTDGTKSVMRLAFFISVITACVVALLGVVFDFIIVVMFLTSQVPTGTSGMDITTKFWIDLGSIALLVTALLTPAFAGKSAQSFAEKPPIEQVVVDAEKPEEGQNG